MTSTPERTGVWSLLPQTVSAEARQLAEFFRHMPALEFSGPLTPEQWRRRNEALLAGFAHPMMQQALNIKPADSRKIMLAGAEHVLFTPPNHDAARDRRIVMHLHGGGYVGGSPETELPAATPVAAALGCPVLSIRYPLWWEERPPADVDRVVAVYRELRKERDAGSIAFMGWSAGGGLALRSTLKLKQLGEPLPAALALATPWTDVTGASDTFRTLMPYDILDSSIVDTVRALVGSEEALRSAACSPIYADYSSDFPPTIIATGTRDALLSDCARLQRKLTDANVENELRVFEGMPHGFMGFRMPETDAYVRDITGFLARHLGSSETAAP